MKTYFILIITGLCLCMNLSAQRGGGGGGRPGGGGGGDRSFGGGQGPARSQAPTVSRDYDKVQITEFPEISGLDIDKKLKLFSILKNERKNFLMFSDEKQSLEMANSRTEKQKEIDNNKKAMSKLDEKINKESLNADKKIRSLLSSDQYKVFIEKKGEIKFADPPVLRGRRPSTENVIRTSVTSETTRM